jgi:predicted phosphodiesterase
MPEEKLTFAHLSDIHFVRGFSGESAFDIDAAVRDAIVRDAKRLKSELEPVQGILITGDIAFAGKPAEYRNALDWLAELADVLGCEREYVWCVPGNHDVDQSVLKEYTGILPVHRDLRRVENDRDGELRKHLENEHMGPVLFSPLKAYNEEFASRLDCLTKPKQPWWTDDVELNDGSILRLRGLNSVLISGLNDDDKDNKLLLGTAQTEYSKDEGVEYLTLCHHPISWLLDGDNADQALMAYSRVQLFGHKHIQNVVQKDQTLWLVAGAVHPVRTERKWIPRYNYLSMEVETTSGYRCLSVDVYARVWSQTEREFTREQASYKENARNYKLKLPDWRRDMPTAAPNSATKTASPSSSSKGQNNTLKNPDRKKLLYHFVGLPHHTRVAIMRKFDLWEEDDQKRSDVEVFATCFERAKDKGALDAVWEAIEAEVKQ